DIETEKIFLLYELSQRGLHFGEREPAGAGDIGGGKIFLRNHVKVEVEHEFARIGMEFRERVLRGGGRALQLNVRGINVAHGGPGENFLLRGIDALEAVNEGVWFADQRRFAPKTHQLRRTPAVNAGEHHAVQT